eukprot:COSAG01_NODE_24402_length_780_cov_1.138032_1_plen_147_part_10
MAYHADARIVGIPTPTPPYLPVLTTRYCDDTQITSRVWSQPHVLDVNCRACMASGGGTEPHKQETMRRGVGRNIGAIAAHEFDCEPASPGARVRLEHTHGTVTVLGVQSGGRADRGTPTYTQWNPAANTPQRPSQQQLDAHREELEW